jgi:hypothetical protein
MVELQSADKDIASNKVAVIVVEAGETQGERVDDLTVRSLPSATARKPGG